jgi:hypothetical protein
LGDHLGWCDGGPSPGFADGSPAGTGAASGAGLDETGLRARLGIPSEAKQVLLFGETSHWDPNWLHTSEEYYTLCIRGILDRVMQVLDEEPRRVFSIESLFFLQRYWQSNPGQHDRLRNLINQRRLRLTGTGITTPDTVLPDTEAILRDYANGQAWLRENGMTVEPRLAYLPDDFGHSPALPTLLVALGIDMAAVTRIDGMYFIGCDYRLKSSFPLQGSSAHRLIHELKTADFVWRGPDGSQVLCHWNRFTYFQGDLLASIGVIRWMDRLYGFSWRTEAHVARRIRRFVRDLAPLARTPYLFCPMGGDFNGPIEGLVALLDRYNRTRYQESGIWAVDAGLDDYLALVDCHRSELPVVTMDPNPYWMGFYASRPEAKRRSNRIVRKLVIAEKLTVLPARDATLPLAANGPVEPEIARDLRKAWDLTVMSNHHDFITGTSPDRIWQTEQLPWLVRAEELADQALARIREIRPAAASAPLPAPPGWHLAAGKLVVDTGVYHVELDERQGGAITSFRLGGSTEELLAGPANDLVSYRDSGGLWRMGHEFLGGVFTERKRASGHPARISAEAVQGVLQVRVDSEFEGRPFVRWLWMRQGSPVLRMRLVGSAQRRRTITCRFPTCFDAQDLTMDVPGGIVLRPAHKLYRPTFWPARSFVHLRSRSGGAGLAVFLGGPAAVAADGAGTLEWIALRHAPREMAFRVLPILSHPASGSDPHEGQLDYAVWFTTDGDARDNGLPHHVRRALRAAMFGLNEADLDELANSVVVVDRDDVQVTALKPAFSGEGVVVRLASFAEKVIDVTVWCPSRPIRTATLCDACERKLRSLEVRDGCLVVPMPYALASVLVTF